MVYIPNVKLQVLSQTQVNPGESRSHAIAKRNFAEPDMHFREYVAKYGK